MKLALFSLVAMVLSTTAFAAPIGKKPWEKIIYISAAISSTQSALNSGNDYAGAKGFYDGDLFAIPAGAVVENIYVVVDEAVVGPTAFNLGDDDSAGGYVASATPLTGPEGLGTTGLKHFGLDYKGAYIKGGTIVTNGWQAKYYSTSGKELKLDVTGSASAGKIRVIARGYQL